MSIAEDDPLSMLLTRIHRAIDDIELSVEREMTRSKSRNALDDEVSMLIADRSRLAEDLDRATANAERLAKSNRDVAKRLDQAMETISTILNRHQIAAAGE